MDRKVLSPPAFFTVSCLYHLLGGLGVMSERNGPNLGEKSVPFGGDSQMAHFVIAKSEQVYLPEGDINQAARPQTPKAINCGQHI